jgi:hypothetical protein
MDLQVWILVYRELVLVLIVRQVMTTTYESNSCNNLERQKLFTTTM